MESFKCEFVLVCVIEELVLEGVFFCLKVISDDNWFLLLFEKGLFLFLGFLLLVYFDVLDENCMFEVFFNIVLGKDNVYSLEKSKFCIFFIFLEDFAVFLIVSLFLKLDGYLSFLKLEVLLILIFEEVISVYFSEDVLFEEEDVFE